jgi:menaquinone C8-methyltransferase
MDLNISTKVVSWVIKKAIVKYLHLSPTNIKYPVEIDDTSRLLYIHIPFCITLCPYCSFHKFRFDKLSANNYFELLFQEMQMVHDLGYKFDSIYFGGGTTTILPEKLAQTIDLAKELFDIKEISCESDPSHLQDLENFGLKNKIDRLSIGIQSFNDEYLKQIGRYHKFGSSEEQYKKVQTILDDFPIVNIDMIYNYPNQTKEQINKEIDTLLKLRPSQVTFYPLMYAPGIKQNLTQHWGALSDKKEEQLYKIIEKRMSKVYTQRSSWAWALKSDEIIDEYVIERSEYIGIGSGAFSFIGDRLYANTFSLPKYKQMIEDKKLPITHSTAFPKYAIKQYRMMIELFGLQPSKEHLFVEEMFLKSIGCYDKQGKINTKGAYIFSTMMKEFYNGMDYIRETMRADLQKEDGLIR